VVGVGVLVEGVVFTSGAVPSCSLGLCPSRCPNLCSKAIKSVINESKSPVTPPKTLDNVFVYKDSISKPNFFKAPPKLSKASAVLNKLSSSMLFLRFSSNILISSFKLPKTSPNLELSTC